jgi:hypothetical protein
MAEGAGLDRKVARRHDGPLIDTVLETHRLEAEPLVTASEAIFEPGRGGDPAGPRGHFFFNATERPSPSCSTSSRS